MGWPDEKVDCSIDNKVFSDTCLGLDPFSSWEKMTSAGCPRSQRSGFGKEGLTFKHIGKGLENKIEKFSISHYLKPHNERGCGGLVMKDGSLNPMASKILALGHWAGGAKLQVMTNPAPLMYCTPARAALCASQCIAVAHNLHAKQHCGICCTWKCHCGDSGFADDWRGQHLYAKLSSLGPYQKNGPSKEFQGTQLAHDWAQIGEQKAKEAMQKMDWLKRKMKCKGEDVTHKLHNKLYWQPGHTCKKKL